MALVKGVPRLPTWRLPLAKQHANSQRLLLDLVPQQAWAAGPKAGLPAWLARLAASPEAATAEQAVPMAWAAARMAAIQEGSVPPSAPLPPRCTVLVNHKFKIVFLKCVAARPGLLLGCLVQVHVRMHYTLPA